MKLFDQFHSELFKFGKFGIVGLLATFVHLFVFSVLMELTSVGPIVATLLAFMLAFTITYLGNFYWTFGRREPSFKRAIRFIAISFFSLLINVGFAKLLVGYWSLHYLFATFAMAFTPFITYFAMIMWVFPNNRSL